MQRRTFLRAALAAAPAAFFSLKAQRPSLQVSTVAPGLHVLSGDCGNIAVLEGPDGLLLIDSGLTQTVAAVVAETGKISKSPVTRLINTHWHYDHVGANAVLGKSGAKILAHENTTLRLSTKQTIKFFKLPFEPLPPEGRPVESFKDQGQLKHGSETLHYRHLPPAHTDGDATIHFQNANVHHCGDLVWSGAYPFIDYGTGGSLAGMAANAERIYKAIDGSTKVIPGHGPVCGRKEVKEFGDMLAQSLQIMTNLVKSRKTLEQAAAARPFADYDKKWGNGFLKPEQWLAMNYVGMEAGHS